MNARLRINFTYVNETKEGWKIFVERWMVSLKLIQISFIVADCCNQKLYPSTRTFAAWNYRTGLCRIRRRVSAVFCWRQKRTARTNFKVGPRPKVLFRVSLRNCGRRVTRYAFVTSLCPEQRNLHAIDGTVGKQNFLPRNDNNVHAEKNLHAKGLISCIHNMRN